MFSKLFCRFLFPLLFSSLLFSSLLLTRTFYTISRGGHTMCPVILFAALLFYKFNFSCVSFTFHTFLVLTFLRMAKSIYKRNTKISYFVYFSCRNTQPAARRRRRRRRRSRRTYRNILVYGWMCVYGSISIGIGASSQYVKRARCFTVVQNVMISDSKLILS